MERKLKSQSNFSSMVSMHAGSYSLQWYHLRRYLKKQRNMKEKDLKMMNDTRRIITETSTK
jgi:hypothetical protein